MKKKKILICGCVVILFFMLVAIFAPLLSPYDPNALVGASFQKPGPEHILGTNDIGQDILSELIFGTRYSIGIGIAAALISGFIAAAVGISAGLGSPFFDRLLMNLTTFVITIPYYPLVILLAALTRGGILTTAVVLGATSWPEMARIIRAETIRIRNTAYITDIAAMGASKPYIMFHHILPEISPFVFQKLILRFRAAIIAESSLSFLGLGSATSKSWGTILAYAQNKNAFLTNSWTWWVIPPGMAILILVFALFLVGYALEEHANPVIGLGSHGG